MKISAVRKKTGKSVDVEVDIPATLADMVRSYGEQIVYNHAKGSIVVSLQGWLRSQLDHDKSVEDITKEVRSWKPGQRKVAMTPRERISADLAKLSPEERATLLKEYRASNKTPQDAHGGASVQAAGRAG
jgi:hypothetical protein